MTDGCETIAFLGVSKGFAEYSTTFDQKMTILEIDVVILERYAQDASSELQQTHLRSRCSLCVACFFARTTAVNPHLNDEKTDSTMLRRWCVSSKSSGFFSCHLRLSLVWGCLTPDRICFILRSTSFFSKTNAAFFLTSEALA